MIADTAPHLAPPRNGGAVPIPARPRALAGIGLRPCHYADILAHPADVPWVEIHPENYLCAGGPQHHFLTRVRNEMPVSFHGVGLSLGGMARPERSHLQRLRDLCARYQPLQFSEHLAWSSHGGWFLNDLLPVPYTAAYLDRMVDHVMEVQDFLGRTILIENPSLYLAFAESDMTEVDFLDALARRSGCGLLLDINNLYVTATNAGADPARALAAFPSAHTREIHLAGHTRIAEPDGGTLLIDTHDGPVADPVWQLFAAATESHGRVPTLIEWDSDLPDWTVLLAEARRAQSVIDAVDVECADAAN